MYNQPYPNHYNNINSNSNINYINMNNNYHKPNKNNQKYLLTTNNSYDFIDMSQASINIHNASFTHNDNVKNNNKQTNKTNYIHFSNTILRILSKNIKDKYKYFLTSLKNHNKLAASLQQQFANHCATIIQSNYKGYMQRKHYLMFRPILRRFKQLLHAVVCGWRIRRIFKCRNINKNIGKIKQFVKQGKLREARILRRETVDQVHRVMVKGKWLQYYQGKNKGKNGAVQGKLKISKIVLRSTNKQSVTASKTINNKNSNNQKEIQKQQEAAFQKQHQKLPAQQIRQQQKQIPIKAKGFYNIPENTNNDNVQQSNNQPKSNIKPVNYLKKSKNEKTKKTNQSQQQKLQQKQQKPVSSTYKKVPTQIKISKQQQQQQPNPQIKSAIKQVNNISIHLPIQQLQLEEKGIPNKTIRLDLRKDVYHQQQESAVKQLGETQKLVKKVGKGIRVTLSDSRHQPEQNNPVITQFLSPMQTSNTKTIISQPALNPNPNLAINPNSINIQQKPQPYSQITNTPIPNPNPAPAPAPAPKDELDQIISVYNSTYTAKKQQITNKFKYMQSINNNKYLNASVK